MQAPRFALCLVAVALAAPCVALAGTAAAPTPPKLQVQDLNALAAPASPALPAAGTSAVVASANVLLPAPVPNPDIEAPHSASSPQASLNPAFLSRPVVFQGNGFSAFSTQGHAEDERERPAAGLNLSVPVK